MLRTLLVRMSLCLLSVAAALATSEDAWSQTVWSGYDLSFAKPDFVDPNLPQNQDRITDNVWITRGVQQGIYNIAAEDFYTQHVSPADTEWATEFNNPGGNVAAENWATLTFEPWVIAYRAEGTRELPFRLANSNAVLHLITDDVYLDIVFTDWTSGTGAFAYMRGDGEIITPPGTTGDYNGNGVVDAADYTVWRDTLGASVTPGDGADGDESGIVDEGDHTFWKTHFGETVPGAAAGVTVAAVPEPASVAGLLLGMTGLGCCSNRWARRILRRAS